MMTGEKLRLLCKPEICINSDRKVPGLINKNVIK